MPLLTYDYLEEVCFRIFTAIGVPRDEAVTVAKHLVDSNLSGHGSHGVIRIPAYVDGIRKGHVIPGAPFEVVHETPTTARVNGNWGFGFVVTEKAMKLAIDKARIHNVSAVTVFYQGHIGRLAHYSKMAASEGMIGLITADSGAGKKSVVPYGGREARLGTNPLSIALPSNLDGPIYLDMATSAVAAGKIRLAAARNEKIPVGLIIDKEGKPTTDPSEFQNGGKILPMGGNQGHKGFGLSFIVEVLSGILTGIGFGNDHKAFESRHGVEHRHNDGCFITVINVAAFRSLTEFKEEVTELAQFVKSSPPLNGFSEVLYPGEPEWMTEKTLKREGIFIEESTWEKILKVLDELGLDDEAGFLNK